MMPCPGTTRPSRGTSPRKKAPAPSFARICFPQSSAEEYLAASSPVFFRFRCVCVCVLVEGGGGFDCSG